MTVIPFRCKLADEMKLGEEQRAWLERVLEQQGVTATALAKKASVDPSTLTRFMSAKRPTATLAPSTIRAIEIATGVAYGGLPAAPLREFKDPEATPYVVLDALADPVAEAVEAFRRGRNSADPWVLATRALEDVGFLPGDILIVAPNEAPQAGDIVCARIFQSGGGAETVFRIFEPPFLIGAGAGARKANIVDGDTVQIRGVVVGTVRPRPLRRAA